MGARALGWWHGVLRSPDSRPVHEVDKYKERGELAGRDAAAWWAEISGQLTGECEALAGRISEATTREERLERETAAAAETYKASRDSHDESRLRQLERDLELVRRERRHLNERLKRAEAERHGAYQMARTSAEAFRDYYEALMRTYCAANRKALRADTLPEIRLPQQLEADEFAPTRSPTNAVHAAT